MLSKYLPVYLSSMGSTVLSFSLMHVHTPTLFCLGHLLSSFLFLKLTNPTSASCSCQSCCLKSFSPDVSIVWPFIIKALSIKVNSDEGFSGHPILSQHLQSLCNAALFYLAFIPIYYLHGGTWTFASIHCQFPAPCTMPGTLGAQ